MRLWQFGRLEGNKIHLNEDIANRLGLLDGSQVFSTMFRYDQSGHSSHEIILSTFGPENYRELCAATFVMLDSPGACAQAAKFLGDRNVDILNSVSLSIVPHAMMVWRMLIDLSYYGDMESLYSEFQQLKASKSPKLDKVDHMELKISKIGDRYSMGAVPESTVVKTKVIRSKKSVSKISNGYFEIPHEFREELKEMKEGQPLIMIGDIDSWILSITLLDMDAKLVHMKYSIPDRPGAIGSVLAALAGKNINLLAVHTIVTDYYHSMQLELIVDISHSTINLEDLKQLVKNSLSDLKGNYTLLNLDEIKI